MKLKFPLDTLAAVIEAADNDNPNGAEELTLANNREGVFLQSANHTLFVDGEYVVPVMCHAEGFNPYAPGVDRLTNYNYRRDIMGGDDFFINVGIAKAREAVAFSLPYFIKI